MRKLAMFCTCGLTAAVLATGCSKNDDTEETTAAVTEATASDASVPETLEAVDLSGVDNGTITLGEYKGIEVTKESTDVTDEEVDTAIEWELEAAAAYEDAEDGHAVADTDQVNIDYVGTKDGVAFEGGTAEGYDLVIGSNTFIDGFEDGLIGAKKGDKVSLNLTFPEDYQSEDLAGQDVVFDVTINNVQVRHVPELDETYVKENTEFQTVDEYRENIRSLIQEQKEANAQMMMENTLLETVINNSDIQPNQEAIDANYDSFVVSYTNQATAYGMDLATFAALNGMTEEDFHSQLQLMAEASVEQRLVFGAIAEEENLTVSDEEREELAVEMGYETAEDLIASAGQFLVDDYIIAEKAMQVMVDNAVIQ